VTRRKTPDGNDVFDLEIKRGKDTLELLRNREIPSDIGSQLVTVDWGSGGLPVANEKNTSTPFRDGSDASADAYEKAIEALANHREVDMVLAALQDMSDVSKVARVYSSVISHCQNMSAISQGRIGFGQTPPALAKAKAVAKAAEAETAAEIAKDAALAEAAAKIAEAKAVARAAEAKTAAKTAKDAADKANADAAAAKAETDAKISKDAADKDAAAKANADAEAAKDAAAKANADAEAAKAAADKAKAVAETAKDAAAKAAAVSEHTDIKDWSDLADKLRSDRFVLLAPWGTAGAVAGMVGSLDYFQSPTFKKVAGLTDLSARLLVDEQKSLLENKVVPVANMRDSGTIVVQGLTTDGDQISVRRVADRAVRGVKLVGNLFIGRLNNEIGRGALKQKLAEFLMEMERAGAIVPSTDGKQPAFALDVYSTQSDFAKGIVSVNLAVRPVRAIDYIYATVLVQV